MFLATARPTIDFNLCCYVATVLAPLADVRDRPELDLPDDYGALRNGGCQSGGLAVPVGAFAVRGVRRGAAPQCVEGVRGLVWCRPHGPAPTGR